MERLLRRIEELRAWRNAREWAISPWTFRFGTTTAQLQPGDRWPVVELPVTLTASVAVPETWAGLPVEIELWLGGEGFLTISTGLQVGLNAPHHRFPLIASAKGGEAIAIEAEVVQTDDGRFVRHARACSAGCR